MALIKCKDCKKEFSTDAKKCPHCGANKPPSLIERVFAWVVIAIFVGWGLIAIANNSDTGIPAQSATSALTHESHDSLPEDERVFITTIKAYQTQAASAQNGMLLGGLRHKRKLDLCRLLPSKKANHWIGKIKELSSNSDGKGILYIALDDEITVGTTNNAVSDSLLPAATLIDQDSDIFKTASSMKVGDQIKFSGTFLPSGTDCMLEGSMTLEGAMIEPEFLMRFTSVSIP